MNMKGLPLSGQHAVVTGATRGIGAAIAASLAAEGATVSLLGRDMPQLEQVANKLGGTERTTAIAVDVTDSTSVTNAFTAARKHFGPVHILVNNAGQAASAKFMDTDEVLWNRILGVNLHGTYLCTRQAVPDMLQLGYGRIINIASIAGLRGGAYLAAYVASKHAVVGLTKSLALELARKNITVNAVCPGYVDTEIVQNAITRIMAKTGRNHEEALGTLVATNPQGRLVTPEEVANTVLWLCRPGSESINGQSIAISGGEV